MTTTPFRFTIATVPRRATRDVSVATANVAIGDDGTKRAVRRQPSADDRYAGVLGAGPRSGAVALEASKRVRFAW